MQKTNLILAFLIIVGIVFTSCKAQVTRPIRIAISSEKPATSVQNYSGWLKRYNKEIEWFNMYPLGIDSAMKLLSTCDGVLITGGEDVYPGVYGKIEDTARCGVFDLYRDSLEFALIDAALENKQPLIGVCRGLQIINVALDGSLIIDIPTDFSTSIVHQQDDWANCFHPVNIIAYSELFSLAQTNSGEVASNHHQGIDILGKGLLVSSWSSDSLPESIEWLKKENKGFLMAVQWHPERMDTLHLLSEPIAKKFLMEAEIYMNNK